MSKPASLPAMKKDFAMPKFAALESSCSSSAVASAPRRSRHACAFFNEIGRLPRASANQDLDAVEVTLNVRKPIVDALKQLPVLVQRGVNGPEFVSYRFEALAERSPNGGDFLWGHDPESSMTNRVSGTNGRETPAFH